MGERQREVYEGWKTIYLAIKRNFLRRKTAIAIQRVKTKIKITTTIDSVINFDVTTTMTCLHDCKHLIFMTLIIQLAFF